MHFPKILWKKFWSRRRGVGRSAKDFFWKFIDFSEDKRPKTKVKPNHWSRPFECSCARSGNFPSWNVNAASSMCWQQQLCFRPKIVQLSLLGQSRTGVWMMPAACPAPPAWPDPSRAECGSNRAPPPQTLPGHPHTNPPSISPKTPNDRSPSSSWSFSSSLVFSPFSKYEFATCSTAAALVYTGTSKRDFHRNRWIGFFHLAPLMTLGYRNLSAASSEHGINSLMSTTDSP